MSSSTKTIEDYKRDVVQLKGMINKLTEKQRDLTKRYDTMKSQLEAQERQSEIDQVVSLIQSAIKIQKCWRGYQTRSNFIKKLEQFQKENGKKEQNSDQKSIINRKVVQLINRELEKKIGIDLSMLFRALDEESAHQIKTETLESYLRSYVLYQNSSHLKESDLKRLIFLLDEGCTGYISQQEMHTCLSAYGVSFEESSKYSRTIELEVLLNFAYRCNLKGFSAEDTLQIINVNHSTFIQQEDIKKFCLKNLGYDISQKESDALFSSFDVYQNGEVTQKQFVKSLSKAMESSQEKNKTQANPNK